MNDGDWSQMVFCLCPLCVRCVELEREAMEACYRWCFVCVRCVELMDRRAMEACNRYSDLSYSEAPSLFLEFHGSELNVKEQVSTAGRW